MAEKKPSNREQIKQIVAGIEAGIQDLFQSEKFADYLRTMSKFHNYSYNNTLLIHMQMPNATRVAGFNKWKNQFGRHVKKGEKGLTIIAPTPFKKRIEEMKLDPDTQAPVLDRDGNVIMEEKEVEIPLFRPVKVFDISQTDGPPLPSLAADLTGDVQQYEAFMEALRRASPVPISFKPIAPNMDGFFHQEDQAITIREGMGQVQTVCAAVHEITHAMLHNREQTRLTSAAGDKSEEPPKTKDKNTMEVEAESVSYTVCQYYNIDTSANSLGYIATWSRDKTLPELKASLETITKTANSLITSIDRHFAEVCKERGVDLAVQPTEQNAPDTVWQFTADLYDYMDQLHQVGILEHPFTLDSREQSIADIADEIQKGHLDGVRGPLNHLAEHMGLEKAKVMLERLDALTGELREHFTQEDVTLWDTVLDEYPMPDTSLTPNDLAEQGYSDGDLLPLSRERAAELLEKDFTVYMVHTGENPEMIFDQDELTEQPESVMFAVTREEWEESRDFHQAVMERLQYQTEREKAFLDHAADCFAIYQVRDDDTLRDIRFESLDWLKSIGRTVERDNYDLVYTAPLSAFDSADGALEQLWYQFNNDHPADFQHPSMSVSDIIALKQNGVVTCHYCDSYGFKQLSDFIIQKSTVAELEAKVKAGQEISMIDLAGAVHREQKKSVVAQLKGQPAQGRKKTAPKKSAEKER